MNTIETSSNIETKLPIKIINAFMWAGDEKKDRIMHCADVFQDFEMLVDSLDDPIPFTITVDKDWTPQSKLDHILKIAQSKFVVAAVVVPNYPELNWRDKSIWKISDGQHYMMLTELLKHFGWENPVLPFKIGSEEFKKERLEARNLLGK